MNSRIFLAVAFFIVSGIVFYVGTKYSKSGDILSSGSQIENIIVDSLSLDGVSKLISEGVCDIEVHKSSREMMIVSYDSVHCTNHSKVDGDDLYIHFGVDQVGFFDFTIRPDIHIQIFTDSIHSFTNRGTGHIMSKDTFDLDIVKLVNEGVGSIAYTSVVSKLVAKNRGVGSIELYGKAKNLFLENEGIGSITAKNLIAGNVKARNSGVGSVNVYGVDSLNITNDGIGSLRYSGPGEVYYERNDGIGSIKRD